MFTTRNVQAMTDAMRRAAGVLLAPQQVDLYEAGTVEVRLHVGQRRAGSGDLTGGADQQSQYATIDAEDWDAKAGRIPQKGDVIHWAGRRYAVESCQIISPDGATVQFYKSRLSG